MGVQPTAGLTYDELVRTRPESNRFEELLDGVLVVSPGPSIRHQDIIINLAAELVAWQRRHGGKVLAGPCDVLVDQHNVVQPDVLAIRADRLPPDLVRPITIAPDLVIEVLSPSNRAHDLVRKRARYERLGVPELVFVDHEADRMEVLRLDGEQYGAAVVLERDDRFVSAALPGFGISVTAILDATPE